MMNGAEEKEIKALFARLEKAWNEGNAKAYAACFTADCDYITFAGEHLKGRQQTEDAHQKLFTGILKKSKLVGEIKDFRFLTSDVAILHGVGAVQLRWQKSAPESRKSINTLVALKENSEWKLAAFHNCRIQKPNLFQRFFLFLQKLTENRKA